MVRRIYSCVPAGYRIAPSPSASSLVIPSEQDADDFIFDPSDPDMEILFDQDPDVFSASHRTLRNYSVSPKLDRVQGD